MMVLISSYVVLLGLSTSPAIGKYFKGKNVQLFFQHDITLGHLLWIPIGFALVFGFSLLVNVAGFEPQSASLLAIGGSGAIMMFIFFRTGSILIPVLIHGLFNSVVIILSSNLVDFKILSNTPFPIPEIGVSLGTFNLLASEVVFQFFLVALSEEMFKMLIIAFVLTISKNQFDDKGFMVYVAGGVSVGIWTVYHLIQAI